jgi:hypothetical protein
MIFKIFLPKKSAKKIGEKNQRFASKQSLIMQKYPNIGF